MSNERVAVLVVEDEVLLRMMMADALTDDGFEVFEAMHAADAIEVLTNTPHVKVIFTDIDMPGDMDGLRLAAFVRDRWPPIKVIITSGHAHAHKLDFPKERMFF